MPTPDALFAGTMALGITLFAVSAGISAVMRSVERTKR